MKRWLFFLPVIAVFVTLSFGTGVFASQDPIESVKAALDPMMQSLGYSGHKPETGIIYHINYSSREVHGNNQRNIGNMDIYTEKIAGVNLWNPGGEESKDAFSKKEFRPEQNGKAEPLSIVFDPSGLDGGRSSLLDAEDNDKIRDPAYSWSEKKKLNLVKESEVLKIFGVFEWRHNYNPPYDSRPDESWWFNCRYGAWVLLGDSLANIELHVVKNSYNDASAVPGLSGGSLEEQPYYEEFRKMVEKVREGVSSDVFQQAVPSDFLEPGFYLSIEALPTSVQADGKSRSSLAVSTYEVDEKSRERRPLGGKKVLLAVESAGGIVPGTLSAGSVTTGNDGMAQAVFTAPEQGTIEGKKIEKAVVTASSPGFNDDEVNIGLETFAPMTVRTEHQILPAGVSFENRITFSFGAPGENKVGGEIKAVITVASKSGRLSTKGGQQGSSEGKIEISATPGVDNSAYYHWVGEQPYEKAVDEVVTVEIPSMGLKGSVPFSVGVDLALTGGTPLYQGMIPGLFVPFKVYVHDRFHKDADLGEMFQTFGIEPALQVVQTGFQPLSVTDQKEDFYTRLAAHIKGSISPGTSLPWDILIGGVFRDKDGGWLLVWKDYEEKGLKDGSLPGLLPWSRGTYQAELRFDPKWNGDATEKDHVVKIAPLIVEGKGQGDAHIESFIIPILKGSLSMFPGGDAGLLAVDTAVELHKTGDVGKAAREIGRHYLLDFLSGKITDAVQPKLESDLEKKVWGTDRGKKIQERLTDLVKKANEGVKGLEKMTGEQIDACIDYGKESLAGYFAGIFAETALDPLKVEKSSLPADLFVPFAAVPAWADLDRAGEMAPLVSFLRGYGGSGIVLVEKRDEALVTISSDGKVLEPAPAQVFAFRGEDERIQDTGTWQAVALARGESIVISVEPGQDPLRICHADASGVKVSTVGKGGPHGESVTVSSSGFEPAASAEAQPDRSLAKGASGIVTASGVRIRDDHSLEGKQVGTADKDEIVGILDMWTSPSDMAIIREDCLGIYGERRFNFKKGMGVYVIEREPDSEEFIVGIMEDGEMVKYGLHIEYVEVQQEQTWYLVITEKGIKGWIFGKFVEEK